MNRRFTPFRGGLAYQDARMSRQVEGLIQLDCGGQFKRVGTIAIGPVVREFGPASFEGEVSGDRLVLRIEVLESGVLLGPFTAVRGRDVQLIHCR